MAGVSGAARDCYGAAPLHALARPSCYRRAAAARALAGLGHVQTSRYARRTGRAGRRSATSSLLCALVELLPTAARRASGSAPHALATRSLRARRWPRRSGGAARAATASPFHTRARAPSCYRRAASAARLWPDSVTYRPVDTLDARAASDDARDVPPLRARRAASTAARRASGSAPPVLARTLSTGSSMAEAPGGAARDCSAPPFTTRARAAVMLPTGRSAARAWPDLATYRPVDTLDARAALDDAPAPSSLFARSSSCCRPPQGGRGQRSSCFGSARSLRAAVAEASGGAARDCYGALHYTCSRGRRATDGPRARRSSLAGLGRVQTVVR